MSYLFKGSHPDLGTTTITPSLSGDDALAITAIPGQTGKLLNLINSSGTSQFSVTPAGVLAIASTSTFSDAILINPAAAVVGVTLKSQSASPTANLLELKTSAGTLVSFMDYKGRIWSQPTLAVGDGVSPSYKGIYANVSIPAAVIGGTQNIKAVQGWSTIAATAAPAEVWGGYFTTDNSGSPAGCYGVVGEFDNTLAAPSVVGVGVMGTYDGVTGVTATPGATGLFSAALCGQVWDRNTTGPTACVLALVNGDTNRQAANPVGAAFKAINRCISFATGFNYGIDFYVESPFTRGALKGEVRMNTGAVIASGTAATRAAVRTQLGDGALPALGSIYLSTTAGKFYFKRANGSADTDWYLVTLTDTD